MVKGYTGGAVACLLPSEGGLSVGNGSHDTVHVQSFKHIQTFVPLYLMGRHKSTVSRPAVAAVILSFVPSVDVAIAVGIGVGGLHQHHTVVQEEVGILA